MVFQSEKAVSHLNTEAGELCPVSESAVGMHIVIFGAIMARGLLSALQQDGSMRAYLSSESERGKKTHIYRDGQLPARVRHRFHLERTFTFVRSGR